MRTLAPIVLFVYNRPWHARQTLTALMGNSLSQQSTLYIFSDGPKNDSPELAENIRQTRQVIRENKWCGEVIITESDINKGLASSITTGVTQVVEKHGRVIVLEDDVVTSPGFLKYMNDALEVWKDEEKVMHISAYMYPLEIEMPETVFLNVVTPWGWATWKRAWKNYNDDSKYLLDRLLSDKGFTQVKYNRGYGQEFYRQLIDNVNNNLRTWAVKWHTVIYLLNGACLHPGGSLTQNIGFDGSGENCGVDVSNVAPTLQQSIQVSKIEITERKDVLEAFRKFYLKSVSPGFSARPSFVRRGVNFLRRIISG